MSLIFRKEDAAPPASSKMALPADRPAKPWWTQIILFGLLIAIMILLGDKQWLISGALSVVLTVFVTIFFKRAEVSDWIASTMSFVRSILPRMLTGTVEAWRNSNTNNITDFYNRDPISGFPVFKAMLCEVQKA